LVIYPEGRLDEGKRLGDFSKGCVKLAQKAGAPIVPLTLVNSGGLMSRDGSRVGRADVRCIISQPIELHITGDPGEKEAVVKIRGIIADNLTA
jgi:1-acyl-sn-glycerol-3-phosphate acyltransferase